MNSQILCNFGGYSIQTVMRILPFPYDKWKTLVNILSNMSFFLCSYLSYSLGIYIITYLCHLTNIDSGRPITKALNKK